MQAVRLCAAAMQRCRLEVPALPPTTRCRRRRSNRQHTRSQPYDAQATPSYLSCLTLAMHQASLPTCPTLFALHFSDSSFCPSRPPSALPPLHPHFDYKSLSEAQHALLYTKMARTWLNHSCKQHIQETAAASGPQLLQLGRQLSGQRLHGRQLLATLRRSQAVQHAYPLLSRQRRPELGQQKVAARGRV